MVNSKIFQEQTSVKKLISFIEAGGPEESEYDEVTDIWDNLNLEDADAGTKTLTRDKLLLLFGEDFLNHTIQGFAYRKPHGYAGDFEMIDLIYQEKITQNILFQKWDKYTHAQHCTKAVRNRKKYFIKLLEEKTSVIDRPLRILNIASGPCRDVLEVFERIQAEKLKIHCVEMDSRAIAYSKNLLGAHAGSVEFTQKNIFRFHTREKYDLIWSAGLFDYFEDDVFVELLSKVYSWCAPSAEIVIGNFSVFNPSRSYMEKIVDWYLFHRTEKNLKELALKAGFNKGQITVKSEALGVNLFLHIKL